jgi:glucan 1,3-beta-glucosidase
VNELNQMQIGFYHVCGVDESVLQGTDFAEFGAVFQGAWPRITNALALANKYEIGVLIGWWPSHFRRVALTSFQ